MKNNTECAPVIGFWKQRNTELIGKRFGQLVIVSVAGKNDKGSYLWNCRCDCGRMRVTEISYLKNGKSNKCSVPHYEEMVGRKFGRMVATGNCSIDSVGNTLVECRCECGDVDNYEFSKIRGACATRIKSCGCQKMTTPSRSPLYGRWNSIVNRCSNPEHALYKYYGGIGISFDPRWNIFETFRRDMEEGYTTGLCLGRKDISKPYSKENCVWTTQKEACRKRRTIVRKYKHNIEFLNSGI